MNITVFCSANELTENYTSPAKEFASLLAKNGYGLVWGGSDSGLMKDIASAAQQAGGKIIGISTETFKDVARSNADTMVIAKNLSERKALLLEQGSAVVMLVGGLGTLDEFMEVLELKKIGLHNKVLGVLNTDNFFEGLKIQLEKIMAEGFLNINIDNLIYFADTPQQLIEYLNKSIKQQ